jgi:hypothetical protein
MEYELGYDRAFRRDVPMVCVGVVSARVAGTERAPDLSRCPAGGR